MNQLSKDTLVYLVTQGGYRSGKDIPALDMTRVINAGQPAGYMSLFDGMQGAVYAFFSSDVVTASSYNEDLAYEKGIAIGQRSVVRHGQGQIPLPRLVRAERRHSSLAVRRAETPTIFRRTACLPVSLPLR